MPKEINDKYRNLTKRYFNSEIFKEIRTDAEPAHCHSFIELVYIVNGKAIQHINNSQFNVSKGDLLLINYNSIHSFEPIGKLEYVNLGFQIDTLIKRVNTNNIIPLITITSFDELRKEDERLLSFRGDERIEIESFFNIMLIEQAKIKENGYIQDACLDMIVSLITNKILADSNQRFDWLEINNYIEKNLNEKLTLEGLAKKCFYNPSYFSRLFKEKFGTNLSTYLAEKRCESAKILLLEGRRIEYIIEKLGFSSRHIFYEQFKKCTGMSVTEFKNNNKIE